MQACDPVKLSNTDLNSLLHADDLVLLSESQTGLQSVYQNLKYIERNGSSKLRGKNAKFYFLEHRSKGAHILYLTSVWLYEENPLEHVDGYCYLGITLNFSGNFKRAQNMLRSKAIRTFIPLFIQIKFKF
jgi:hypothetical protein